MLTYTRLPVTTNESSQFESPAVDRPASPEAPAPDYAPITTPAPPPITVLDPDNPPWAQPQWLGALIAFLVWVGSVLCLIFVPLVLVLPYIIYSAANKQLDLATLANNKTFLFLSVLGVIPAHLVTLLIAYFIVTKGRKFPFFKTLGFSWPPSWRTVGFSMPESWTAFKGMVICGVIAIALFAAGALITKIFPGQKTDLDILIESSYGARVVTAFLAVFTAPLVEEVIYRGMLYPAISRLMGAGVAIGLVSLLFASVHFLQYWNNLAVVAAITLVSITLTTVRALSRSLLPCFVIHLLFNGIQAVIFLVYPFFDKLQEPAPKPAPADLAASIIQHIF